MIKLTESDIDKIMQLARFKPTLENRNRLLTDLNTVMGQMEIIEKIDTEELVIHNRPIHRYRHKA